VTSQGAAAKGGGGARIRTDLLAWLDVDKLAQPSPRLSRRRCQHPRTSCHCKEPWAPKPRRRPGASAALALPWQGQCRVSVPSRLLCGARTASSAAGVPVLQRGSWLSGGGGRGRVKALLPLLVLGVVLAHYSHDALPLDDLAETAHLFHRLPHLHRASGSEQTSAPQLGRAQVSATQTRTHGQTVEIDIAPVCLLDRFSCLIISRQASRQRIFRGEAPAAWWATRVEYTAAGAIHDLPSHYYAQCS
jgi:hypothetical protein